MRWFNQRQTTVLGIDIGTSAVKLVELSRSESGYRVESYVIVPLSQDADVDKNSAESGVIANAVKIALKQSRSKTRQACVAVASSSVITKVISMPSLLSEDEMEEQIWAEADQYVPYPLDKVNLDFEVLGETENENEAESVDVLLVACLRENVEHRAEILESAGLKALRVDVDAFAMENAVSLLVDPLLAPIENHAIAVVDMGATTTTLNVLHEGRMVYTREQAFGGKQLTEEIHRHYGLSYEEADFAKKQGSLPDNYAVAVLNPFKKAMVQHIRRLLQFFTSSDANREVDSIVFTGGCSSIAGLETLLKQHLGLPVLLANPFINMTLSDKANPQRLANDASAMMIACGLALRGFD